MSHQSPPFYFEVQILLEVFSITIDYITQRVCNFLVVTIYNLQTFLQFNIEISTTVLPRIVFNCCLLLSYTFILLLEIQILLILVSSSSTSYLIENH